MPTRRTTEAKRGDFDQPGNPPISPFASAEVSFDSDDSSVGEPRPVLIAATPLHNRLRSSDWTPPSDRSSHSSRRASPDRHTQKRMPTMVVVLLVPAFLMLVLVASVSQGQPTGRHRRMAVGTHAFSLAHNWGFAQSEADEVVADFLSIFQERKPARRKQLIRQLYGETDPAVLWNATSAAGPANWPLGSQAAMCEAFAPADARKLAIVGNGPLTDHDRGLIKESDRVLRFNAVNNMLPEEPVDVWVVRYNEQAPLWYWGLPQLPEAEVSRISAKARGLLFLDGPDEAPAAAIQDLLYWFPHLPANKLLQLNITDYWGVYSRVLDKARGMRPLRSSEAMPSSGLLGLLAALSCVRVPRHEVHLFGFNWSPKSYYMHKMTSEELIARELILQFRMTVHKPACDALYSCDPKCDSSGYRASIDGTGDDCTSRREARKARREAVFQEKRRIAERKAADANARYDRQSGWGSQSANGTSQPVRGTPGIVGPPPSQRLAQLDASQSDTRTAEGALAEATDPVASGQEELGEALGLGGDVAAEEARQQQQEAAGAAVRKQIIAQRLDNRKYNPRLHPEKAAARAVMYPDDETASLPDYGLEPKLASLRRDVLALLTDGHRIEQGQAVRLTGMLHQGLVAKGLAPVIEVKAGPKHSSSERSVQFD